MGGYTRFEGEYAFQRAVHLRLVLNEGLIADKVWGGGKEVIVVVIHLSVCTIDDRGNFM